MKIKILSGGIMPTRAHETDAGLDLKSRIRSGSKAAKIIKYQQAVHIGEIR